MKKISLLVSLFILSLLNESFSQNGVSKWDFGVSLGVNSLKLKLRDTGSSLSVYKNQSSNIEYEKKGFNFQGYAVVKYNINKRWKAIGNIGVLSTKDAAHRKHIKKVNLLSKIETTKIDTVKQEYLILDIPIYIRWNIIATDNKNWKVKPFMDLGLSIKIPLSQETYFGQEVIRIENQLFGNTFTTNTFYSGKLKVEPPFVYFAIGFLMGKKSSISLSLSGINTHAVGNENIYFSSLLKSLRVARFF